MEENFGAARRKIPAVALSYSEIVGIGVFAHELRNLLCAIQLYAGLIAENADSPPKILKYTAETLSAAERASSLADELLGTIKRKAQSFHS
jgi:hypothetical protein